MKELMVWKCVLACLTGIWLVMVVMHLVRVCEAQHQLDRIEAKLANQAPEA